MDKQTKLSGERWESVERRTDRETNIISVNA